MGKKLTQIDFIERCISGNPDLDYSETVYRGSGEKVCIKCKKHGEFWIKANDFLRSFKCPNCSRNVPSTEEFVSKCKNIIQIMIIQKQSILINLEKQLLDVQNTTILGKLQHKIQKSERVNVLNAIKKLIRKIILCLNLNLLLKLI